MRKKVDENVKRKNETADNKKGKYMPRGVTGQGKQVAKLTKSHS